MIGVLSYQAGNVFSVVSAIRQCGGDSKIIFSKEEMHGCSGYILPGVGSFQSCAKRLKSSGLWEGIQNIVDEGVPLLGICLGFQLLFEYGEEEGGGAGFGFLPGRVTRFQGTVDKVPHVGWNTIEVVNGLSPGDGHRGTDVSVNSAEKRLFNGSHIKNPWFYFVHSYTPIGVNEEDVAAWCKYDERRFPSAIERGNLFGVQFHPEKSQGEGLALLRRFLELSSC